MKHDFTLSVIIIVFACAFIAGAFNVTDTIKTFTPVSSRAFPLMIGIGMLLSGIWLGWETWRKHAAGFQLANLEKIDWKTWCGTALVFFIYIMIIERVGYLISTAVFLFIVVRILGSRGWIGNAIFSVFISIATYFLFNNLLKVGLPNGLLQ